MDAREQLRRYLEQRREMGETELVLDRMTVDEAMRLLGGGAPGRARPRQFRRRRRAKLTRRAADPNDWRAILRAAMRRSTRRRPLDGWTADRLDSERRRTANPAEDTSFVAPDSGEPEPPPAPIVSVAPGISVGTPSSELFGGPMAALDSLEAIACARRDVHAVPAPFDGDESGAWRRESQRGLHVRRRSAGRDRRSKPDARSSARRGSCSQRSSPRSTSSARTSSSATSSNIVRRETVTLYRTK